MADLIVGMLAVLFSGVATGQMATLGQSVESYSSAAWNFAQTVNKTAVTPVASALLSIVVMLSFVRISTRYEGDQKTGAQQVGVALIKAALVILAVTYANLFLGAIHEVGQMMTTKLMGLAGSNEAVASTMDVEKMKEGIATIGIPDQIAMLMLLIVPWLITQAANLVVMVMIIFRFAEIYILSAFAPLPITFLGHEETKSIGVGYLKKYAAVVLQGVVMILVSVMYRFLAPTIFSASAIVAAATPHPQNFLVSGANSVLGTVGSLLGPLGWIATGPFKDLTASINAPQLMWLIMSNYVGLIGAPVLLIVMLLSSGKIARAIMGEG